MYVFDGTSNREMSESEAAEHANSLINYADLPPSPQEQMLTVTRALAASVTTLSDTTALAIPDLLPHWDELLAAGNQVAAGVCLTHKGQTYRVVQDVTPLENQPPDMDGMLAVYRPIEREHTGTLADPIPWVYGMDCYSGKYYAHGGTTYLCKSDMLPCVWEPGSAGTEGQWEAIE